MSCGVIHPTGIICEESGIHEYHFGFNGSWVEWKNEEYKVPFALLAKRDQEKLMLGIAQRTQKIKHTV